MPILELTDFITIRTAAKPLLGIDYGDSRIGVAICDNDWRIASPMEVIKNKKFTLSADRIFEIIDERKVNGLVIGLPLNMDDTENAKCQSVRQFGRNLIKIRDINICFFDERFSSQIAENVLDMADMGHKRKSEIIDKIAAGYILQSFIDKVNSGN